MMANTITLKTSSYDGRYLQVVCTQAQDIVNNRSTINWTISSVGGSVNYYAVGPTELTIGGQQVYYKKRMSWDSKAFPAAAGSVSGSFIWEHDNNGMATLEVKLSTAIYTSTKREISGTWELNRIPRGATLLTAQDFNDEGNPTITYSNPAGNAVSELQAYMMIGGNIVLFRDIGKTGSSYTFSLTQDERNYLRSLVVGSNSKTVSYFLITTIGSSTFNSSVINKTFSIINGLPTLNPTVKDKKTNSLALTGNPNTMVRYYNDMSYTIGATALKGATIVSQKVVCGDITATASSGSLGSVVSNTFIFTATDSRNNTVSKTITIPMIDYVPLTCDVNAKIALDSTDNTKANITLSISGNYFNGSFGAVSNTLQLYYSIQYGSSGGATLNPITIPSTAYKGTTYSFDFAIPQKLDYKGSYTVQVQAIDKAYHINSKSKTLKAVPVFDWSETDFNFNVPIKINNKEIDYIVEQGEKDGWTYRKWNSGIAEAWYSATVSGIDVGEFNLDGMYHSGSKGINFPFTFTEVKYVNASGGSTGNMNFVRPFNNTNTMMTYIVVGMADRASVSIRLNAEVKGKWK